MLSRESYWEGSNPKIKVGKALLLKGADSGFFITIYEQLRPLVASVYLPIMSNNLLQAVIAKLFLAEYSEMSLDMTLRHDNKSKIYLSLIP